MTLSQLKPGESATIVRVGGEPSVRTRLMEMGLLRGEPVKLLKYAPFGDPIELLVSGYHLSLRKHEASYIDVEREGFRVAQ
ncbi:ferrous iron transport protein A [Candidatus Poribacteria bacterium]|nr:ferrous iron transport protein A [Candidatus Poribacteria bacterium]